MASELVAGYGEDPVVGPVDLNLAPGVTALLGRNGAGKTTLMRTLCGVIPVVRGSCTVLGSPVSDGAAVRSHVGYLGHQLALASGLTVIQNLRFWSDIVATYPDAVVVPVDGLVARFDLAELLDTKVSALSRGQRQRVDLARLSMTDPQFIVLDEPLTGLDPVYAAEMRQLIADWGQSRTVLYSTHSVPEALELAKRCLVVAGGQIVELSNEHEMTATAILKVLGGNS